MRDRWTVSTPATRTGLGAADHAQTAECARFLIEVHAVLGPEIVLAEQKTVIGGDDERGVLPHVAAVEIVEQLSEQEVAHRHHGIVVRTQFLTFGRQLVDPTIARPVADRSVPAAVERRFEPSRRMEWLMRIEGLELEQPIVGVVIAVKEIEGVREALTDGKSFSSLMNSRLMMFCEWYLRRSVVNWRA